MIPSHRFKTHLNIFPFFTSGAMYTILALKRGPVIAFTRIAGIRILTSREMIKTLFLLNNSLNKILIEEKKYADSKVIDRHTVEEFSTNGVYCIEVLIVFLTP